MSKEKNLLADLKYVIAGLFVMAISVLTESLVSLYKFVGIIMLAGIGVYIIGYIVALFGSIKVRKHRKEYSLSLVVNGIGLAMAIISALLIVKDYRAFGLSAFIGITPVFARYWADVCMLVMYYLHIKGILQLMAKNKLDMDYRGILKKSKICIVIILVSLVFIPFAHAFSGILKYIIGIVSILVSFIAKLYLLKELNSGYREV